MAGSAGVANRVGGGHVTGVGGTGEELVFPPEDLDLLLRVAQFLETHEQGAALIGPDGERIPLPSEVYHVLRQVLDVMRQGKATLIAPQDVRLTTQEAADFLGVSRPTVVKLLEEGAIPFEQPNRHRRVRLHDLLAFQRRRQAERHARLNELTKQASELGLYDDSPADYERALRSARRRHASPPPPR